VRLLTLSLSLLLPLPLPETMRGDELPVFWVPSPLSDVVRIENGRQPLQELGLLPQAAVPEPEGAT